MAQRIIGVFGSGNIAENSPEWKAAEDAGRLIAKYKCIVLTGGLGGVMEAACKGAKKVGGTTVGILPGDRKTSPPNPFVDIVIYTGMGEARNVINVKSCDAAIAVGGEFGTLSEIALALKTGCPLVLLDSWSCTRAAAGECNWLCASDAEDAVRKAILTE